MQKIIFRGIGTFCLLLFTCNLFAQTKSVDFDGMAGHITLDNIYQFDTSSAFTVEAWIKTNITNGVHQIINKTDAENNYKGWGFQIENNELQLYLVNNWAANDSRWYVKDNTNLIDGQWHHVAAAHDGTGSCELYIDGVALSVTKQGTITNNILNSTPTTIGAYIESDGNPYELWEGRIDEIRIWDDVRNASEIANNKDCPLTGTEANLIGYWDLEEGTGNITTDKAGNETGTIIPGALWSSDNNLNCNVGQDEIEVYSELQAFPNPFSAITTIESDFALSDAQIYLYDAHGRCIRKLRESVGYTLELDGSHLPAGKYYLRITTTDGYVQALNLMIVK